MLLFQTFQPDTTAINYNYQKGAQNGKTDGGRARMEFLIGADEATFAHISQRLGIILDVLNGKADANCLTQGERNIAEYIRNFKIEVDGVEQKAVVERLNLAEYTDYIWIKKPDGNFEKSGLPEGKAAIGIEIYFKGGTSHQMQALYDIKSKEILFEK
jgi:hypothetical protein